MPTTTPQLPPEPAACAGPDCALPTGSVSAERFVSDYADEHLFEADNPRGMCANCEHYRRDNGWSEEGEDWCWIKEGKYADGLWHQCPAWIASQNTHSEAQRPENNL